MLELTEQNWNAEVLNSTLPVVVDFWGPSCTPCQLLEPLLVKAAQDFEGTLKFVKVNAMEQGNLTARYGVRNVPTLLLFRNGKVVGQTIGNMPTRTLMTFLQKVL